MTPVEGQRRYGAEVTPIISIVQYPGRPVIWGVEVCKLGAVQKAGPREIHFSGDSLGVSDFLRSRQGPKGYLQKGYP